MRTQFVSAYDRGRQWAIGAIAAQGKDVPLENVIFRAYDENPMKSSETQRNFIQGVSSYVNEIACIRTHRMIYGKGA